jgi:hypothetical protein
LHGNGIFVILVDYLVPGTTGSTPDGGFGLGDHV